MTSCQSNETEYAGAEGSAHARGLPGRCAMLCRSLPPWHDEYLPRQVAARAPCRRPLNASPPDIRAQLTAAVYKNFFMRDAVGAAPSICRAP